MKHVNFKVLIAGLMLSTGVYFTACKSKPKDTGSTIDTAAIAPAPVTQAPVQISPDDSLKTSVKDATKDFPGVKTDVNNGEITLTGEIQRTKLQSLMMSLNSLKPKKINNQLTIK